MIYSSCSKSGLFNYQWSNPVKGHDPTWDDSVGRDFILADGKNNQSGPSYPYKSLRFGFLINAFPAPWFTSLVHRSKYYYRRELSDMDNNVDDLLLFCYNGSFIALKGNLMYILYYIQQKLGYFKPFAEHWKRAKLRILTQMNS